MWKQNSRTEILRNTLESEKLGKLVLKTGSGESEGEESSESKPEDYELKQIQKRLCKQNSRTGTLRNTLESEKLNSIRGKTNQGARNRKILGGSGESSTERKQSIDPR